MPNKLYKDYIVSTKWKQRKELFALKHPKICSKCGSDKNIELHHRSYKNLGNEPDKDLMWLCNKCHIWAEKLIKSGKIDRKLSSIYKNTSFRKKKRKKKSKPKVFISEVISPLDKFSLRAKESRIK